MSVWSIIYRFSWGLLAVLVAIGFILIFTPKTRKLALLQDVKTQLETRNTEKAEQIKELKIRQERFNSDPEFVEHTAREAEMIMPDETVYKFTNEPGVGQKP